MATYWINKASGSDTNAGTSESAPFATIAKWLTVKADGDVVNLYGGSVATGRLSYYEELEILSGLSGPLTIRGYGHYAPIINGGTALASWTLDSGSVVGASLAVDPLCVVFYDMNGNPTKGIPVANKAAINAEYKFFWDDPSDTLFRYGTTTDVGTTYSAIRYGARDRGIYLVDIDNVTIEDVAVWGVGGSGIDLLRCDGATMRRCDSGYNSEDGMGGNDCLTSLIEFCRIHHNGKVKGVIASPGDGISWHGLTGASSATGTIRGCLIYSNSKAGVDNVGESIHVVENCLIYDNYANLLNYTSLLTGLQTFRNNIIVASATDGGGIQAISHSNIYGNTFYGPGTGTSVYGIIVDGTVPGATINVKNNLSTNFGIGFVVTALAGLTLTENNNSLGGNGAASFGAGFTPDASDLTSAPQLTNPGGLGGDYRLKSASPCRNAGANLISAGVTRDYAGRLRDTTPDIGALSFGRWGAKHNADLWLKVLTSGAGS